MENHTLRCKITMMAIEKSLVALDIAFGIQGLSRHTKTCYKEHWKLVLGDFLTRLSFKINTLRLGPRKAFVIEAGPEGFEPST